MILKNDSSTVIKPLVTPAITILSQPKKITSYKDIVLNKHGIVLKNGVHQAVFLPQVPKEQGWNLVQTLEALSEKAGLPKAAWKDKKTTYEVFEGLEIQESVHI